MARYTGPLCRLCRIEQKKLFLKGDRCKSDKCPINKKRAIPGKDPKARTGKRSDYGVQLREKQRLKRMYGLLEKQFRGYFERADRMKGITGSNLLVLLERRLDNVVFRLGFAPSRNEARQLVRHSHFLVNGRKVNIPSYTVRKDDVVELREKSRKVLPILDSLETVARRGIPGWLELDKDNFKGVVKAIPTREDITMPVQEQLVVELYSK